MLELLTLIVVFLLAILWIVVMGFRDVSEQKRKAEAAKDIADYILRRKERP